MSELHLLSPLGFRASAVYAGIKTKQTPDVGLLVCDTLATAAAVFTTNQVQAAPVLVALDPLSTMMVFMPPPMAMTFDSMIPPAADRVSLPVPK